MCPGFGESRSREVVIAAKVHAVQQKAEYNRLVALILKIAIFLNQRANKRVRQVRSRKLNIALDVQGAVEEDEPLRKLGGYLTPYSVFSRSRCWCNPTHL